MRKLLLTVVATSLLLASQVSANSFFKQEDKQLHMAITAMIGVWGSGFAKKFGATDSEAFWIGIGSALAVGFAKEVYDSREGGTGFDGMDMVANGIGGALGSGVGTYVIYKF